MKKSILSFLLLFAALATFATRWTAPSISDYSDRFVVYTQVNVNGMKSNNVEVAAFIDGQVRGVANYTSLNSVGHLNLEVRGNESDNGKTITFKVAFNSLVYKVEKTLTYQHQRTYTPFPFVINVDAITGVALTNPININQVIGTTYDLTNDISFLYEPLDLDGAPESYNRMYETTLDTSETPLTYMWDFGNSSQFFTVGDNNILTVRDYNENLYLGLMVSGPMDPSVMTHVVRFQTRTFTTVNITKPLVPVTDILLSETTVKLYVYDSAYNVLFPIISFVPSDASNQAFKLVPNDAAAAAGIGGEDEKYIAKIPGTYSFRVVSAENENIYKNLTIIVVQPVTDLIWDRDYMGLEIWKGDNAYEEIAKHINILPANATDKTLIFSPSDASAFGADGKALATGTYNVIVGAKEGLSWLERLNIEVIVKQPVEAIRVTPNKISVNVGDNVRDYIYYNVNVDVLPETAQNRRYLVEPSAADADYFPGNLAKAPGTYTWIVKSDQNPEITASITVNVSSPVSFDVPDYIELSLVTPGQGAITNKVGDIDPSLVRMGVSNDYVDVTFDGTNFNLTGRKIGDGEINVYYDGRMMGVISFYVKAELPLAAGWNWVSNYTTESIPLVIAGSDVYNTEFFTGSNKILEARSQAGLLYNDTEQYGAFGTITVFDAAIMYKICVENARSLYPGGTELAQPQVSVSEKGYTWITYPIVGNHTMDYFNNHVGLKGYSGCVIMGKDGFAEHNNGRWIASAGFKLETGKGYIFYQPEQREVELDFGESYVEEQIAASAKPMLASRNPWQYDASAFADNMAVVAKIKGIEAGSRYSVGAFVGDECRGMGQFVTDEAMFINVAGAVGEKVNFRLYDSETGCYSNIIEGMSYTMKRGSVSSPVTLTPESAVTGIMNVESSMQNSIKAFNVQGQQVNGNAKGLLIIGGKKVVRK